PGALISTPIFNAFNALSCPKIPSIGFKVSVESNSNKSGVQRHLKSSGFNSRGFSFLRFCFLEDAIFFPSIRIYNNLIKSKHIKCEYQKFTGYKIYVSEEDYILR